MSHSRAKNRSATPAQSAALPAQPQPIVSTAAMETLVTAQQRKVVHVVVTKRRPGLSKPSPAAAAASPLACDLCGRTFKKRKFYEDHCTMCHQVGLGWSFSLYPTRRQTHNSFGSVTRPKVWHLLFMRFPSRIFNPSLAGRTRTVHHR